MTLVIPTKEESQTIKIIKQLLYCILYQSIIAVSEMPRSCNISGNYILTTASSATFIIGNKASSLSPGDILACVGIISETVSNVAADFFKYRAFANKANASISAARHLYFFTIAGLPFS